MEAGGSCCSLSILLVLQPVCTSKMLPSVYYPAQLTKHLYMEATYGPSIVKPPCPMSRHLLMEATYRVCVLHQVQAFVLELCTGHAGRGQLD